MIARTILCFTILLAVMAGVATAGEEVKGPLHLKSSQPDSDGYRQKLWVMSPDLDGFRTYVYRDGGGNILFDDEDNGTTNDEFDVFCPGADGSDGEKAKILPEKNFGPGTLEVWQNGLLVFGMKVNMCGPTIGVPASSPDLKPASPKTNLDNPVPLDNPTSEVPPAVKTPHDYPKLAVKKGCRRLTARTAKCVLIVKNEGSAPAFGVRIIDALPRHGQFLAKPKGTVLFAKGRAIWSEKVSANGRVRLVIRVRATRAGRFCNRLIVIHGDKATDKSCLTMRDPRKRVLLPPVTG